VKTVEENDQGHEIYKQKMCISITEQFSNCRYILLKVSQSFAPT